MTIEVYVQYVGSTGKKKREPPKKREKKRQKEFIILKQTRCTMILRSCTAFFLHEGTQGRKAAFHLALTVCMTSPQDARFLLVSLYLFL